MSVTQDRMICGICKGKRILINEVTGKNEICPKCYGKGHLIPSSQLEEIIKRPRVLLHG